MGMYISFVPKIYIRLELIKIGRESEKPEVMEEEWREREEALEASSLTSEMCEGRSWDSRILGKKIPKWQW